MGVENTIIPYAGPYIYDIKWALPRENLSWGIALRQSDTQTSLLRAIPEKKTWRGKKALIFGPHHPWN